MSIPSSSELVVISARSSPAFNRCSSISRRSRESEPWYGCASSSSASALTRPAIRSACARLLTKISVVRAWRIRSSTSGATEVQIVPPTWPRSGTGERTDGLDRLHQPAVDDGNRPEHRRDLVADPAGLAPAEEARDLVERALRRRETDALRRPPEQRLEALEGEREMRSALSTGERVDLVDDHHPQRREHPAPLRAGEQDVQRLGGRDQDVRRLAQHPRPVAGRRVAGADRDADLGEGNAGLLEPPLQLGERGLEVALDVVA